jgi:hypothetical protein
MAPGFRAAVLASDRRFLVEDQCYAAARLYSLVVVAKKEFAIQL